MQFIETKVHGYLDYLMAIVLLIAPWVFNFDRDGAETWVPVILGAGMIVYSLLTDYEMGAARYITMRTHLIIDFVAGAFLAASPWIFDFHEYVSTPHLVLGIAEMASALFTKRHPSTESAAKSTHSHRTA